MMDRFPLSLRGIVPGLYHPEDEEAVAPHEACIGDLTFEIGEAFSDEGRGHLRCLPGRQSEGLEFVDIASG